MKFPPWVVAGVTLWLAAGVGAAAERTQLAPIDRDFSVFAPYAEMHAYQVAVRNALLGAGARRSCEAVIMPSFEREWSVHLQQATTGGGPEVVCTIMQRQLWGEMQMAAERRGPSSPPRDQVSALAQLPKMTSRSSAPLSSTTAVLIERLWGAMLARVERPPGPVPCIDGTSFFAFQWRRDIGSRGGWGQCPGEGTPMAGLLDVLKDLRKCAGSSGTALMQQDMKLAVEATRLLRRVEQR